MKRRFPKSALWLAALLAAACGIQVPMDTNVAVVPDNSYPEASAAGMFVAVTATYGWTLSLEFPEGTASWASVDPASGTGSKADVRLRFSANESEEERQLTLVLKPDNGASAQAVVRQAGKKANTPSGKTSGYGYDVAPAGLDWLELPAMVAGDGRELLIHNLEGTQYRSRERDGTRNWSCYWDYESRVSVWVAYPHNNSLKGSGERTNQWGLDPLLPEALQYSITQSFPTYRYYSDPLYDRGHQIPSADRLNPRTANVSTFYPTNMTPQSRDFNSDIWGDLENKVRSYLSGTDTLYVVTGCLIDQTQTYVTSFNGRSIAVPTHYFKALLAHTTGGTVGQEGYLAAGFLLPHSEEIAKKNCLDYICSIDQLEKQTGMDFFPNLIKKIGENKAALVESEAPSSWWK